MLEGKHTELSRELGRLLYRMVAEPASCDDVCLADDYDAAGSFSALYDLLREHIDRDSFFDGFAEEYVGANRLLPESVERSFNEALRTVMDS